MRTRALLLLGLAAVLAVFAVFLARNWLEDRAQPATVAEAQKIPLTTVVVARTQLVYGNRIGREHLREVDWPVDSVPQGAFKTIGELISPQEDRIVLRTIEPGEPILPTKVTGFGERATLSAIVEKNMRAVTIRVDDVAGVAGFLVPGDKVDVMVTRQEEDGDLLTDILLQNVKVLGVDQRATEQQDKPAVAKAVTLEVTPIQAQKLTLAQRVGQLSLALRNVGNVAAAARETVTLNDLKIGEINRPSPPKVAEGPPAEPEPAKAQAVALTKKPVKDASASRSVSDHASVTILRGMDLSVEKVLAEEGAMSRRDYYDGSYPFFDAGSTPIDLRPPPIRARSGLQGEEGSRE